MMKQLDIKQLNFKTVIENTNYFFALLFAFVMPLNKKMLPYIIGLWFLTWILERKYISKFRSVKNNILFIVALLFYIFHVIGLIYSKNFNDAVFDIQVKLTLLFAPLVFAGSNKIYKIKSDEILLSFVLGNLVASLFCFLHAIINSVDFANGSFIFDPFNGEYHRFLYFQLSMFHHVSYFAMFLAFSIAIITYFFIKKVFIQKRLWRIILIISYLIFVVTIYLLSSKAGLLVGLFVIGLSLVSIVLKYQRKNAYLVLSVLFILISISGFYLVQKNTRIKVFVENFNSENKETKTSRDMRLDVWYSSLLVIQENFIFGVGAGDIHENLNQKFEEINFQKGLDKQYNSHQQFLETFIGQGIIGLFLLLFLLFIPFYRSIEEKNFLWFAFIFIVFINFLFESMLNTIAGVSFFAFFYGLLTFVKFENIYLKIPFSPPRIDSKIIHEVVDTLNSGWITTGPKTKLFEKRITEYCGCERTLCVNSATSGLKLMLRWFGVGPGDEVIVPAYTYSATANVVIHSGAKLILVDVNESDFNISLIEIEKAITSKTKVIIPVDFSGYPCDYDEINKLINEDKFVKLFNPNNKVQEKLERILVMSDAAHSLGAVYKGKKTGSLTDVSVFSFHAVKNLTTGEGGAIALNFKDSFNNDELYDQLNVLSLHGQTKDAFRKTNDGNWKYDIIDAGYKSNMTDISASMGLVELERYEQDSLRKFKETFKIYTEALKDKEWAIIPEYYNEIKESSYHIYPVRIKDISEERRDKIMTKIMSKGVAVNVHFMPVPMFTFYKKLGYTISDYPVAYQNYASEITLPVFYDLTEIQIDRIIKALIESVESVLFEK